PGGARRLTRMDKVSRPRTIAVRQQQQQQPKPPSPNKLAAKLKAAKHAPVKTTCNKFELSDVFATSRLRELQKNTKSSASKVKPASATSSQNHHHPSNQGELSSPTKPKSTGAFKVRPIEKTKFRYFYDRADLPLRVNFSGAVRKVQWQVDITQIDYSHYLPLFFEGLRELDEPYRFLALNGTMDMLEKGGDRPLTCIPHLVIPIKQNLMTRHPTIMCIQMKVLQKLVLTCPYAGEALVPYYRQILTIFNLFATKRDENIGDLIIETLYILERHGGEDAFVNIKYDNLLHRLPDELYFEIARHPFDAADTLASIMLSPPTLNVVLEKVNKLKKDKSVKKAAAAALDTKPPWKL
ncbi:hypothetical protein DYB38_012784, partial [Aphanomyces astaci]